jgi:predicted PurR-regulated permease PerM
MNLPAARPPATPPAAAPPPHGPRNATRAQRLALALGLVGVLLFSLWYFSAILTPFVLAACLAYFLDPPVTFLQRLGVRRAIGAFLMICLLCGVVLFFLLLIYPLVVGQVTILVQRLPSYAAGIGAVLREVLTQVEESIGPEFMDARLRDLAIRQAGEMLQLLGSAMTGLITRGIALFNLFALLIVTPFVAFYLLRDWPAIIGRIESWLPRRNAAVLRQLALDTDRVLSAWLRGQLLVCLLMGLFYAITLTLLGLELGLLVGLVAGLLSFIPYVGTITGFVLGFLLALGQYGSWQGVMVVMGVFVAGNFIEGYILYPRLLGDRVQLHAVWVFFALFAGGVAFGFLGVLLAVPMAAAIGVVARYWLRRYLESPLYLDPPRTGS